jgi:hypothetical protein
MNKITYYRRYSDVTSCEKRMNSLIMTEGERIPKNGTTSTCNQLSTVEPITAPTARLPTVINAAFPEKENKCY